MGMVLASSCKLPSLKHLSATVQFHLVHDRTFNPLTLALRADENFQSHVSSYSALILSPLPRSWVMSSPCMLSTHLSLLVLLLLPLLVPVLAVLLLLRPPPATLPLPLCAGITDLTVILPRSVVLPAPGRETSRLAGRCILPSCWCFRFFSDLTPGPSLF